MKIDKITLILVAIIILMSIGLTYMFMAGSDHEIMIQDKQLQHLEQLKNMPSKDVH